MGYISSTNTTDMKTLVILAIMGCALGAPSELVAPEPVEDTPEVAAAQAEFAAAYEAQVAAVEEGVLPEVINPAGAPESVVDTDEVGEAKAVAPITYATGVAPLTYPAGVVPAAVAPLTYAHVAPALAPIAPLRLAHPFGFAHAGLVL